MDPNATLDIIVQCASAGDGQGALEACTNLLGWFSRGGYEVGTRGQRDAIRNYFNVATGRNLKLLKASFA